MACGLLKKWLAYYDPIHMGYTLRGIVGGVTATGGWSFPWIAGGYDLYRGTGGAGSIDFENPIGAAGRNATSIANFGWRPHAADREYRYAVKSVGGGGVESAASHPALVAEFDGAGNLIGLRPNSPVGLQVRPAAGGAFEIRWTYTERFEEAGPDHFEVYHDNGTGTVDYGTFVASVSYRRGKAHYVYASAAFAHSVRRVWGVRAVTAGGTDDGNTATAFAWSDASAPPVHPLLRAECVEEAL